MRKNAFLLALTACLLFIALDSNEVMVNNKLNLPKGDHTFRDALPSPDEAQVIYCTTHDRVEPYDGSAWQDIKTKVFDVTQNAFQGDLGVLEITTSGADSVTFCIPADYHETVSLVLLIIPENTDASADVDLTSDYGGDGEAYNVHSESNTTIEYGWTANQHFEADISSVFTSLAAGDICGLKWDNNVTGIVNLVKVKLEYR